MKFVLDARLYGLENAGLGRYVMNLVKELKVQGKKHQFFILLRKKYYRKLKFPRNWEKIEADFRHYGFAEQLKLPFIIKKLRPDLVHFPHFNTPFFYRGKFVVTIHDLLMHQQKGAEATTLSFWKYYLKRLGYRLVFDHAVRKAKKIIVPSKTIKRQLTKYYNISGKKINYIHEGVDSNLTRYSNSTNKLLDKYGLRPREYLIYAGNAYPHKNLNRAIEAAKLAKIKLLIVSTRNVFVSRLKTVIKDKDAGKFVELTGYLPDKELGSLLKNSLAFLFPSLSEGFGLPGLEAMALETLLLASDIPVFQEVYQNHALYFDPKDSKSIALAIETAKRMPSKQRSGRVSKAKKFVSMYSWEKMVKETLKLYNRVYDEGGDSL